MARSVSFIIAALNEKFHINGVLDSIKMQDYSGQIELILADGGSTDGTVEIAKKYGCKIFQDSTKLPEARMHAAFKQAKGELVVFLSADNRLVGSDWLVKMTKPFENPQVQAATTHPVSETSEHFLNRYFNNLPSDPLTFFVHGYCEDLREMKRVYPVEKETNDCIIYKFNSRDYPTIAMHQGFTLRKTFQRSESSAEDDILPIIEMIEKGHKIAYVPTAGIRHLSIYSIKQFFKKFRRRTLVGLTGNNSFQNRLKHVSWQKKARTLLAPLYFASFAGPAYDGVHRFFQTRDKLMLLHPFVCWLFLLAMLAGFFDYLLAFGKVEKQKLLTTK